MRAGSGGGTERYVSFILWKDVSYLRGEEHGLKGF